MIQVGIIPLFMILYYLDKEFLENGDLWISKQKDPEAVSLNRSSSTSCEIKNIIFNGESYSEPVEIGNSFNTFFSEIASEV